MRRAAIIISVSLFSLLSALFFLAWALSYTDGFFWLAMSRGNGFSFVSVQSGTFAFCVSRSAYAPATEKHFWRLEPEDMFNKQPGMIGNRPMVTLPGEGSLWFAVAPPYYPWRWQLSPGIEGFVPIWLAALISGIVPIAWAVGLFDAKPSQPSAGKKASSRSTFEDRPSP